MSEPINFKELAQQAWRNTGPAQSGTLTLDDLQRFAAHAAEFGEPWENQLPRHAWCKLLLCEEDAVE